MRKAIPWRLHAEGYPLAAARGRRSTGKGLRKAFSLAAAAGSRAKKAREKPKDGFGVCAGFSRQSDGYFLRNVRTASADP
jgi:hypothetical protein